MILFLIGCFDNLNTGAGGHFYSLLHTSKSIGCENRIVVVGDFLPQMYEAEDVVFVKAGQRDLLQVDLAKYIPLGKVKTVHIYDITMALMGSKLASQLRVPLVCTKPGGPPINPWSMSFKNQIVFHQFDFDYFKNRGFLPPRHLCQISNRVAAPVKAAYPRTSPFGDEQQDKIKLLRIGRIGRAYRQSVLQSIHLADRLGAAGKKVALAVVGKVEDQGVYEEICRYCVDRPYVSIFTDESYTVRAAELIVFSDVIVGTGRGFIEGLSHGKLMFFPLAGEHLPCFMNSKNYREAFHYNFSERTPRSNLCNPEAGIQEFLNVHGSPEAETYRTLALNLFQQDHLLEVGVRKLEDFYRLPLDPETRVDFYWKRLHGGCLAVAKRFKEFRRSVKGRSSRPSTPQASAEQASLSSQ